MKKRKVEDGTSRLGNILMVTGVLLCVFYSLILGVFYFYDFKFDDQGNCIAVAKP